MKELYEELELEVIRFKTEDIITTSDAAPEQVQDTSKDEGEQEANPSPEIRYGHKGEELHQDENGNWVDEYGTIFKQEEDGDYWPQGV